MTLQQADYPDWLRVESTIIPVPFIGGAASAISGFPYSVTSAAVLGPFNVAPWPTTQMDFAPSAVNQRLSLTWFDDAAMTHSIGQYTADVGAGLTFSQRVRNAGPYLTAQILRSGGGICTGNLWLGGASGVTPGPTRAGTPIIVDFPSTSVGAGASVSTTANYAYAGGVGMQVHGPSGKWTVAAFVTDISGNNRTLYQVTTAALDVNVGIALPPRILTLKVTNNATRAYNFQGIIYEPQSG